MPVFGRARTLDLLATVEILEAHQGAVQSSDSLARLLFPCLAKEPVGGAGATYGRP
jgi:hypothetical protein